MVEPKKGTKWPTNLPRFENRQDAIAVCRELCKIQYLLRAEKKGKGELNVSRRDRSVYSEHMYVFFSPTLNSTRCHGSENSTNRDTLCGFTRETKRNNTS